ncbi:M23 family metallopeptidase [Streptomyces griseomycini]|uniref:Murein DD-endopeptidase MepM/ murein hydrolase activator NlpD n=1 Tax=Streptomyces griseomycini TaxID=66895 RepID=A0A7W7PNX1_9ACTN|nr:M23 family metallopeptidase [Streptomyces griseomycini]MBB4897876.1 murein DD-endopeptidase MepM/ murein hydrolase activator NlpD [Streptomyces griseomycini]GGQ09782.1 peptidase [Streptomyces griseomycini]GGR47029.1 peptidase [Streptomyces griseomycini]
MRLTRRHPLLVAVSLCALAVLAARPADGDHAPGHGSASGISAQVARLYEEAAAATERYEAGRRAAEKQKAEVRRLEKRLDRERREMAGLHEELGRIASSQYRSGGGLPLAAHMILADDPEELMRGQRAVWQAELSLDRAIEKSERAEERLARDEGKAAAAWKALQKRNAELAALKQDIERKLETARWKLQGQADASVAAGACRGAVRLEQPETRFTTSWVAPVETYALSASYGSGGAMWANRHTGQDFAVPIGTPVRAVGAGTVVKVSCGGAFGIEIVLEHADGYHTQYAHLAAVAVDQGDRVSPGQWIGQSGTSGNSTGPHLHFEVRVTPETGSAVDPVSWLARRGVSL